MARESSGGGRAVTICVGGAIALLGTPVIGAEGNPGSEVQADVRKPALEEIVVSARKRTESLMDVPVAISAISEVQLANNLATDFTKIGELAPQVIIGRSSSGTGSILTIRGISSGVGDPGLDQSVLVSVDNVPITRGRIIETAVFDMQQVDILAGPQALFFGKNSPAGVVSLRSKDPTDQFEASVKTLYEFEADERWVEGVISGPLTDGLNARLAVLGSWMDGWMENVAGPVPDPTHPGVIAPGATNGDRNPDTRNYAARLTLLWAPSDSFDASFKFLWNDQQSNGQDGTIEPFCVGQTTHPTMLGVPESPAADCKLDKKKAVSSQPSEFSENTPYGNGGVTYYDEDVLFGALTANARFQNFTLTSTTGYYSQDWSGSASFSSYGLVYAPQAEDYELITQELRVNTELSGSVNFMVGAYYEHSERSHGNFPDLFHFAFNTDANNWTTWENVAAIDGDSYSAFAQVQWSIVPSLELTAGARYSRDEREGDLENLSINPIAPFLGINLLPAGQVLSTKYEDDNVSPEAMLTWHFAPDQIVYGGYKSGYKSGGISNGSLLLATDTPETVLFDSEEVDGFEIGYKGDIFDGTLRLDVAAYLYNYDNLQVSAFDSETVSFRLSNAAEVRTEGVTASFNWLATDRLSFNGNVGFNRARYQDFKDAACYTGQTPEQGCTDGVSQDRTGKAVDRAPDVTFSLGADYRVNVFSGWLADLSVSGFYSDSYDTATDYHPGGFQDSYWRLNAAVHLLTENEKLRLSLIGRNLTDSYYMFLSGGKVGGNADELVGNMNRPREVALQLEYRF